MIKKIFSILTILIIVSSCSNNYVESKYAVIIAKNDTVIYEAYFNEKTKDSLTNVQSITKGIISVLIGIAIDEKYILSENESIAKYFPNEFKNLSDKRKSDITIKHLLNQTSGLTWNGYLEDEKWLNSSKSIEYVLNKSLEAVPGEKYNYNSGATHLLSVIISKSTGGSTLGFAKKYLFTPLDIRDFNWEKRNQGYHDGAGFGLAMKPNDLLKIGQLLLNKGKYDDKQIISSTWIEKSFNRNEKKPTMWGLRNSTHGYCWYKAELNGDQIDYGMGYGGQFIILVQKKNLVIVATHNHDTPNGIEHQIEFLSKELPKLIAK